MGAPRTTDATSFIAEVLEAHIRLVERMRHELEAEILAAAEKLGETLGKAGKVLICGNGGSAADAQHFAAELVGRFGRPGQALAAVALTVDTSILTALGNDKGFSEVFSTQVEALGRPGDLLLAISTSGRSANVLRAIDQAVAQQIAVVALTGTAGRATMAAADVILGVPSTDTQRIQEMHSLILHLIGEIVVGGT